MLLCRFFLKWHALHADCVDLRAWIADIAAAETARLIEFPAGSFGLRSQAPFSGKDVDWKEVGADLGVRLLEQVCKDWQMVRPP